MKRSLHTVNSAGVTLVELLIVVCMLAVVGIIVSLVFPKTTLLMMKNQESSAANGLAASTVQQMQNTPYLLLPLTPATTASFSNYFQSTANGPPGCDCSTVDFTQFPNFPPYTDTVNLGGIKYTRYLCINEVKRTATGITPNGCNGGATNLEDIHVRVSWMTGSQVTNVDEESLASQGLNTGTVPMGTVRFVLCQQIGNPPTSCDITPELASSIVSVYNIGYRNWAGVNAGGVGSLSVPQDWPYVVRVQNPHFFPYVEENKTVGSGTLVIHAHLLSTGTYSSEVAGEVFIATHPVISKVVAQYDLNIDSTQIVEIYNPTPNHYYFGAGGNLRIDYCKETAASCGSTDLTPGGGYHTVSSLTVNPHSYFLIVGVDTYTYHPTPPNYDPWGVKPDVYYKYWDNSSNFISTGTVGNGIQLMFKDSNGNWSKADAVSWVGTTGNPPFTPPPSPMGPWETHPPLNTHLPNPYISPGNALVRANRRGETYANPPGFGVPTAPGSNNNWGQSYDSDDNTADFGVWGVLDSTPLIQLPVHNTLSGAYLSRTGTPATLYTSGNYIEVLDPTSPLTQGTSIYTQGNSHFSSQLAATEVMGPDSVANFGATTWPVIVVVGTYTVFVPGITPISESNTPPWTLLERGNVPPPTSPSGPSQPCTTGILGPTACDTDEATVPWPGGYNGNGITYGQYPDLHTPYLTLDTTGEWGLVNGQVQDANNGNGIPAVPVSISDNQVPSRFPPIEKITDANGNFSLLVPASGAMTVMINSSFPVVSSNLSDNMHYFDARFFPPFYNENQVPWEYNITLPPWNMGSPGTTNICDITQNTCLPLNPVVLTQGKGAVNQIQGQVTTDEGPPHNPVPHITIQLLDTQGHFINSTQTNDQGNYSFNVDLGSYNLVPSLNGSQVATPTQMIVYVADGNVIPGQNFTVRGAPANVKITSSNGLEGTVVLLSTFAWTNTNPPPINQNAGYSNSLYVSVTQGSNNQAFFSVIPGFKYYVTCWLTQLNGTTYSYQVTPSNTIDSGSHVQPMENVNDVCPTP